MTAERLSPNPLAGLFRLLFSRGTHLTLGVVAVLAMLFCGFDATRTRPSDGTIWLLGRPSLEVLDVTPRNDAPPTPLARGDYIVGIDRHVVTSPQKAAEVLRKLEPGTTVPYLIKRDGQQFEVNVPLTSTRVDFSEYSVNVVLTLIYLVIGIWVYWRSSNDRAVSLFYFVCLLFGLYFMTNLQQASYFLGAIIAQNIGAFARFMLPTVFLHFFLVFPSKNRTLTRHPFLAPLLYLFPLMFYLRFTLDQFFGANGASINATSWIVLGIYYVLGLGALLYGYFSNRDPLMRERVRILTFGTLAAVIPFLIFKIAMDELAYNSELARFGVLPLAAIPICFGYCVARYRVMQIDFLLKRSLSYGLLTGLTWAGFLACAWWLGDKVLSLISHPSSLVAVGVALTTATALWPARARIQRMLDHRFYHSRDNIASLIEEFSKEIPRLIQRDALLRYVGYKLRDVLDLPGMAIYLPKAGGEHESVYTLTGTIDQDDKLGATEQKFSQNSTYPDHLRIPALAKLLETHGEPFWADSVEDTVNEDREAITREQADLNARLREQAFLTESGIQLLIPLVAQDRLLGLVALPLRPGDEDYQLHELQLLTIVAGQVAMQMENARLYEEEISKQKLEEEMRNARQIQARLLPRSIPAFDGVEIEAVNISSKQVSGDYYDLIERQDGQLALVIADVSGKGMPASILASNIQAALRAVCDTSDSPAAILERINIQIHASTDPQHFATLFFAMFDPTTFTLRYCSAGHNAPVIMRTNGEIELLEAGGLPLGAFDFGTYDEGNVTLNAGDLLFLYTDGVTETKGPDGDEDYGEDRLNELLRRERANDIDGIFKQVSEELYNFSGSTDADDDITMIALKIAAPGKAVAVGAEGF